jgi:hypothetical protein
VRVAATLISLKCHRIEVHIVYFPVTNAVLVFLYGISIMTLGRLVYKIILTGQCQRTDVIHIGRMKFGKSNLLISIPNIAISANYDKYFS